MITTNYSANNQPTFGRFVFSSGAKNVLKNNLKSNKAITKLSEIVENESQFFERVISIDSKNEKCLTGCLTNGPEKTQGFFQSPLSFLKEMIRMANKEEKKCAMDRAIDGILM